MFNAAPSSKPKSTLNAKKPKAKKSGLGGAKKANLNFAQLESESKSIYEQQEREKAFISANKKLVSADNSGLGNTSGTTIDSKPVSEERRKSVASRLGMGAGGIVGGIGGGLGGNKSSHISSHMLDFQEIRQIDNQPMQPKNHSILNPNLSAQEKINQDLLEQTGVTGMRIGNDIMENSTDISDLLGKKNLSGNHSNSNNNNNYGSMLGSSQVEKVEDNDDCVEYDQYGVVSK